MSMRIEKLTEYIGAEVEGVDITLPLDEESLAQLRQAFCTYGVLVFHDQVVTDEQHTAFSEGFGPLEMTIASDPIGDGGPVGVLTNVDEAGELILPDDERMLYQRGNGLWHSDGSFRRVPLRGSLLAAKAVPPAGGETEFASLCAAYAALPQEKKDEVEGLVVEHSLAHSRAQIAPDLMSDEFLRDTPPAEHPLVRTVVETGEKALLVGSYTTRIIGWPLEEGKALLQELLEWAAQPQFVYRHQWRLHDLVMWDNRCCLHRGRPWDGHQYKRIMHRTTLAGDGLV